MTHERKMAWTVVTVDGESTRHVYDISTDHKAALRLAADVSQRIGRAFTGRYKVVLLDNPTVLYNPSNVIRIVFDISNAKELEAPIQEEARRSIGFKTPKPN